MVDEGSILAQDYRSLLIQDELNTTRYELIPHILQIKTLNQNCAPEKVWETIDRVNRALSSTYTPSILYTIFKLKVVWKTKLYRIIGGHKQALFNTIINLRAAGILEDVEKDEDDAHYAMRIEKSDIDRGAFFRESAVTECYKISDELNTFVSIYITHTETNISPNIKQKVEYLSRKTNAIRKQNGNVVACTNCGTTNPRTVVASQGLCLDCMSTRGVVR